MTTLLFERYISVTLPRLTISEGTIRLDIALEASDKPPEGFVEVFNLKPETRQQVKQSTGQITIEAGHRNNVAEVFRGSIHRVTESRRRLDRLTKIELGDVQADDLRINGITNRSYALPTPTRDIVRDIIVEDLMMPVGARDLENIPLTSVRSSWSWGGTSREALKTLLYREPVRWFEEHGAMRIVSLDTPETGRTTLRISPETGLIGSPEDKEDGIEVRTLMLPHATLNAQAIVKSETYSGAWFVYGFRHKAINRLPGDFVTILDLRPNE